MRGYGQRAEGFKALDTLSLWELEPDHGRELVLVSHRHCPLLHLYPHSRISTRVLSLQ